jgi:thiazole/oxazole-forming peptide maturase SagD family component
VNLTASIYTGGLSHKVITLMRRIVSPLCGLDKALGYSLHDAASSGTFIVVAQLSGAHRLSGMESPPSYHLGGYGLFREEAMMRALGETGERYAHMVYGVEHEADIPVRSLAEMEREGRVIVDLDDLRLYTDEQLASEEVGYARAEPDTPLGWLRGFRLDDREPVWAPAQLNLVGYSARHREGEPRIGPAFSTGTAAHTRPAAALQSALLELVQMDSAMGYWYAGKRALRIDYEGRLPRLESALGRVGRPLHRGVTFHYLPSPDLPGHTVTCVLWTDGERLPAASVGVATDLDLEEAMYKAFLESTAIPHLALVGLMRQSSVLGDPSAFETITDLDTNVVYYALPENLPIVRQRFPVEETVAVEELPSYPGGTAEETLPFLLREMVATGKRFAIFDLTSSDVADLGLVVFRAYSPDLLCLCPPSTPYLAHRRIAAYGGFGPLVPHPYP